ncbi:MAG: hypothetical protein KJS97_08165 [Alphaproteobacteria bacterium]|nr:hypothetical protein [Alphaproteobacteria bacterium]
MRKLLLAAAFALTAAAPAFAADDMAAFYGNTAVVTDSAGAVVKYQFDAGGKYAIITPNGAKITGSYTIGDGKVCLKPDDPKAQGGCAPQALGKKVGDVWDVTNDQGQKLNVKLVAGR